MRQETSGEADAASRAVRLWRSQEEGWLYLSFVLDTYSRRVVGWSMANNLRRELVLDAVNARPSTLVGHLLG
jgi:transposase InsO family protein